MDLEALGWNPDLAAELAALPRRGLQPGRIVRALKLHYAALTEEGELTARLPGRARVAHETLPVVGDWVGLDCRRGRGALIRALLPRRTRFARRVPGKELREQVLVANVDSALLVSGLDADFNVRRIERYLALCATSGATPLVVLNKSDACGDVAARLRQVRERAPGVALCAISALRREGLEALDPFLARGRTAALLGSSGVGKSTLVNALLDCERMRVGPVRARDGRGMHVTTRRELVLLPGRGAIIDTPGLRELQIWGDRELLDEAFPELAELAAGCRFADCAHDAEPGCAVRAAVAAGALTEERLLSYCKLRDELDALETQQRERARSSASRRSARRGSPPRKAGG